MARKRYGKYGWLAITLLLASGLVFSSWSNYRGALDVKATLTRGQADLLSSALRSQIGQTSDSTVRTILQNFLTEHQERGVRYAGLLNPDGTVTASVGEPILPPALPAGFSMRGPDGTVVQVGNRLRVIAVRPPPRQSGDPGRFFGDRDRRQGRDTVFGRRGGPGERPTPTVGTAADDRGGRPPNDRGGPPFGGGGRGRGVHTVMIEFEPVLAQSLVNRAERSLLIAAIGAAILGLAAFLAWRTSERYAHAELRLEEQKRLSVLGEMSAVLAHEIRNPLASLKGNAQLLTERLPADSKERGRAERVVSEATRLEALTADLLDFARTGPLEFTAENPVQVLRASIDETDEDAFVIDQTDAPATWRMDAKRIRHTLVNILQNARQAALDRKPVVRIAQERNRLIYEVRDFGPGLPAGSESRIFDPFFTTRTNGTGLGLAVARRVAEMHGGTVSARNHADGGAVFRIELPEHP